MEWIRGNEWLYVGCTKDGIARPVRHHVVDVAEPVQDADIITFTRFTDQESALAYEKELIVHRKPKYNIAGIPENRNIPLAKLVDEPKLVEKQCLRCKRWFIPKRPWEAHCHKSGCKRMPKPIIIAGDLDAFICLVCRFRSPKVRGMCSTCYHRERRNGLELVRPQKRSRIAN